MEAFCRHLLATRPRLDFIINNACQTVRRPPDFYAHMMARETASIANAPDVVRKLVARYENLQSALPSRSGDALARVADGGARAGMVGLAHAPQLSQLRLLEE